MMCFQGPLICYSFITSQALLVTYAEFAYVQMYLILNNDICSLFVPQSVSMATGNLCATAGTPEEIADIFNNYFTSVFSVPH